MPRGKKTKQHKKATRNKENLYEITPDEKKSCEEKKIRVLNGVISHDAFSSFRACFS